MVLVCVELTSGSPSDAATLTLDPSPGSASSKLLSCVCRIILFLIVYNTVADFGGSVMVTFPAASAEGMEVCAEFNITDDNIAEAVESFTVTGSGGIFLEGQNSTQVNIQDNDGED